MASKKKKKKFSEQVITGTYESSMTKDKVGSALKSNSMSVAEAYKSTSKDDTSDRVFSAFDDGYDVGDITKSLLKGSSKLGETIFNTGKEIVTNPIQTVKTGGIGILSGVDKASDLINSAVSDFVDWVVPGEQGNDSGLSLKEFNDLSNRTDEKTKQKILKEYEKKYGKDSAIYKTVELKAKTNPAETGALNWYYKDSDTYKKAQAGELSEGQQNIYGVGENIGAMIPSVAVSTVNPVAGTGLFFTQAQQGYTEDAKERGYSDTEARTYGMIMATAEVVVERLGFDELGGMNKLSNGSIMKAMGGEALEEAVMPYIEDVVTYGIYEDGYSWEEFGESTEESVKGAVMGATVGGIMRASGKGYTKVDALVQKAQNGQEITQDDIKGAIEELKEKEPGYIEKYIEEGLNVVKEQNATMNQHTTSAEENLQDIAPVGEIDTTEIDEIAPVVAQEVLNPTLVSGRDVRTAGQQDIAPVEAPVVETEQAPVQDNRYVYTPQETDSQYKQAVSKSAETVGLENNASTQTMIDLASKVSERTGKQILFTNNSQPEMIAKRNGLIKSYAKSNNISIEQATTELEGTTINGLTDGESILINTDSNGYLNVIVGHEITHTFENTGKLYTELQDAVFKYASEIGEFEEISDRISRIYEGQNANLNQELTSELVGRYLFTDQSFIDSLKAKKPNVFQRMYNEIKHLIKMATAGSKEAKALEEVKYRFEKAMNSKPSDKVSKVTVQETKDKSTTEPVSNTKEKEESVQEIEEEFSLSEDNKGRKLSEEQIEFFEDSVVRDENGNLLTMYHGTRADFNVFESDRAGQNYEDNWSRAGRGHYFTPDIKYAKDYGEASVEKGPVKIKEVYLNITNPFDMATDYSETLTDMKNEYNIDEFYLKAGYRLIDWFRDAKIDSTEVLKKYGFDGIHDFDDYIAFESNQIKDVENKNPTESDDIRYSLTRASYEQIKQAVELEEQGKTPEEIYLETGAYKGAEGIWKTEIDDSRATVKISSAMVGGKYKLKEILDFPKLYKAYPGFKEMTVIFDDNMLPNELGSYNTDTNTLTINSSIYDYKQAELLSAKKQLADWDKTVETYKLLFSEEQIQQQLDTLKDRAKKYKRKDYQRELKSTLLHELQHVIQQQESFTGGASPSYWRSKQLMTESYREAYRERENELYHKMGMDKFFDEMMGKVKEMSWEEFQQAKEEFIDNSEYGQQYRDLQKLMEKTKQRYEILTGRSAYELYRDTAGEEEARDVQTRMDWSSKDRKRFMPYTGGPQTVFYEGFRNENKYGVMFNQTEDTKSQRAIEEFGTTTNINEAGYLTTDGKYLDFSGKKFGGPSGSRTMDHRDIGQIYNDEEYNLAEKNHQNMGTGTAIMQDFIEEGNIRIMPEQGVDIALEPTAEQYDKLYDVLSHIQKRNGEVYVDLDTETKNRENLQYSDKTSVSKMIGDIKNHYNKTSYSLSKVDNKGRTLSEQQQEHFKDSKARDENGNLVVLYHGTYNDEMFTVFDPEKGFNVDAIYLTPDLSVSSHFGNGSTTRNFDKTLIPRINEAKTVEDLIKIFNDDLNNKIEIKKSYSDENGDYYRLETNEGNVSSPLGYKVGENAYSYKDFNGETKETNLFDKLKKEALEDAYRNQHYASNYEVYANIVNPLVVDAKGKSYHQIEFEGKTTNTETISVIAKERGYDGVIVKNVLETSYENQLTDDYIVFNSNQIKDVHNTNPTDSDDIRYSLSKEGEELAPIGDFNIKGSDVRLQKQVEEAIAPLKEEIETLTKTITDLQEDIAPASFESAEEQRAETQRTMTDEDAPLTDDGEFIFTEDVPLKGKGKDNITREIANDFGIKYTEARELYNKVANTENPTVEDVFDILSDYRDVKMQMDLDEVNAIQHTIKGTRIDVSEFKKQITDYKNYRISNMGKGLILGNSGEKVDSVYQELNEMYGDNAFPSSVTAEVDQLDVISQWLYKEPYLEYTDTIDDDSLYDLAERILLDVGNTERYKTSEAYRTNWFRHYKDDIMAPGEAPRIKTEISQEDYLKSLPDALTDDYAPFLEQAREVNASNTENTAGNVSISDELSRLSINPQEEVNEAQNEVKYEIERPLENPFDDFLDNFKRETRKTKAPRVTKEKPGLKSAYGTVQELIFNDTYQVDKLAKETNRPSIKHNNYMLKGVYGEIPGDILVGQTDNYGNIIGKSVKDLWKPAHDSGLFNQFNDRMKHQLNIERWKTNKPLWFEIPADASKEIVKAYDETYPQFKEWADDIYNFYANSLDNKFEAGLVNESQRKLLREELYPSYVRIDVEQLEKPYVDITPGEIRSKAPLKRAVGGSGESAMSLEESMIKSVYADKMGIRQNKLYLEIAKALEGNRAEVGADVRQELADMSEALYLDADTGQHYLTAYENGEQFTVEIDKELYDGLKNDLKQTLKNIETKLGKPLELVQKAGNLKRDLTTTYNPFFWLTNPPKDLFDGLINSKNVKGFMKNYPIAWKEAITNTGDAPKFRALYGSAMDMGDYASESGLGDTDGKLAKKLKNTKLLRGINKLNEITEVVTRLAEFKASKEAGASLEEAMYNAREVTVNFDRGGTVTKFLDRNGFKFLNVSAQGFDKFIRNFSGQEGARATMGAWSRAVAFGIAPALINHLLFGGDDDEEKDEDYEALPDYIKDNYFLFKMDNGEFVRIPKGRMMAVFGSAGRRTLETLEGEEDAFEGFLENSESQVGMANPFDNFLLAPLFQAYGSENGTTWYGEELIPSRLQDKAPEEQYDASTDKLSIFLGETFGISPYKLNYVIDQYTGGIGDLVLPMITEETKTDGSLMAPFVDKFTANSTDDNKYASEIYSLGDKRDKVPTAEKETDLYKIQDAYLYSITSEMGELYAEKREVQADSSLSKKEKYEMVQEIQKQINSLAKEGLENYEYVSQKENYAIVGGREFNKYTASDGSERWGTPWEDELNDLNAMGMDLAEKNNYFTSKKSITEINDYYKDLIDSASEEEKDALYTSRKRDVISAVKDTELDDEMKAYLYNKYYSSDKTKVITKLGIDFDSYLDFESQQFEADKNSAGKSISGSKKAKVFNYINSMNLDFEERLILAKLQYSSYDQYNAEIINYLNNHSDISYDEEVEILQKLGFTVDENGRIYWK